MGTGRGWTVGLGALSVAALATVAGAARGAGLTVTVTAPIARQGIALGGSMDLAFEVGSEALLRDTTVTIAGISQAVSPSCTQPAAVKECRVAVPLTGVPRGAATVSVRVETTLGEVGTATTDIVVDEAPSIGGLRNHGLVTTPTVTVTCADLGAYPCRSIRLEQRQPDYSYVSVASGTTSATWATASADGSTAMLRAVATDTAGIESTMGATILVDLTPGIANVSRVPGTITAVSSGYIVFEKLLDRVTGDPDLAAPHEVWLRDRATGVDTLLSPNGKTGGTLAQGGYAEDGDGAISILWGGTKQSFPASAPWGIVRGSRYWIVAYPYGSKCFVRDLATSTETELVDLQNVPGVTPICQGAAIAPNGDYYVKGESTGGPNDTLVKIAGGVATVLPYGGFRKDWVVVDAANRVAYSKKRSTGATQIYIDGTQIGYGWEYAFRDGFLAYVRNSGGMAVRQPDGTEVARQFFGLQTFSDLGENGEFGFFVNMTGGKTSQYLVGLTAAPIRVAGGQGRLSSVGTGWLLAQGDTLRCGRAPCGPVNPIPAETVVDPDAGSPTDASSPPDAGMAPTGTDASAAADASTGPATAGADSGCNSGGGSVAGFGIPAVVAAFLGRRRRRTEAGA